MADHKIIKVVKAEEVQEIIKTFHISFTGEHFNIYKTIRTIKKFYNCENIVKYTQIFIKKCKICQRKKFDKKQDLLEKDLRHKIKSAVGFSNTKKLNDDLKRLNNQH